MMKTQNPVQQTYHAESDIYKYSALMKYLINDEVHEIMGMQIKSIAIDSDYKNANMPMIFVTVALDKNLIDLMVQNQDTGIVVLNISRSVANSDMPDMYNDYINGKFIYFISEDINKTASFDYSGKSNEGRDDIFKIINIGLLSQDHVNNNKKLLNGVVSGKMSSILYHITSHMPILIEPPIDNKYISDIFIPPLNSTAKIIKHLNSLRVLYKTNYRFFIDFDCSYLISSSGGAIKRKDEDISTIFLVLRDTYEQVSKIQGMIVDEDQKLYQIECDSIDCELSDNHISEKSYSKISATNTSGKNTIAELSNKPVGSSIDDKTISIRVSNDNTGLVDNMVSSTDSESIQVLIQKTDLDSSVITMNKEYYIKADEVYKTDKYNGRYILTRKRELYVRYDETFTMNTMLLFEKVPNDYSNLPKATSIELETSIKEINSSEGITE